MAIPLYQVPAYWNESNDVAAQIVAQDAETYKINGRRFYVVMRDDELFAEFDLTDLAHSLALHMMAEKERKHD